MNRALLLCPLLLVAPMAGSQVKASFQQIEFSNVRTVGFKNNPATGDQRVIAEPQSGGFVTIRQKTDTGYLELASDKQLTVDTKIGKDAQGRRRQFISKAVGSGNVKVTQFVEKTGVTTVINGTSADYLRTGTQGTLDLDGPVAITQSDAKKNRKLLAKGRQAQAKLLPDAAFPLQVATLTGNVTVDVDQLPYVDPETKEKVEQGTYKASGGKLVYDTTGPQPKITMTENVRIEGLGGISGVATGIKTLVMTLTANGELSEAEANGDSIDATATQKPKGGPRRK